jgi:hypothetical protein
MRRRSRRKGMEREYDGQRKMRGEGERDNSMIMICLLQFTHTLSFG